MGSPSSTQSGVIVPFPDDTTMYYIFTVNSLDVGQLRTGFRYTLVDTKISDGYGGVVADNKNVLICSSASERITSVHHQNNFGVWVIMHEWESSRFRAYLITPQGISIDDPVISDVGLYHGPYGGHNRNGIGYMKLSPNGKKLAIAVMGLNVIELFDFNDATGVISNPVLLPVDALPYGVEFSSGGQFLYASERLGDKIYQWDLFAGMPEDIRNSREVIGILENPLGGALQMASDGRIYIARKSKPYLSRINHPGRKGPECGFEEIGVHLNGPKSKEGLPTFIQSYFNNYWIIRRNRCIDEDIEFTLSSFENIDSVYWDFGDPVSGVNNHSKGELVYHRFSEPGTYTVTAKCFYLDSHSIKKKQVNVVPLPEVELGNDTAICRGDTVTFYAGENYQTIEWLENPGNTQSFFKSAEQGYITVKVANVCGEASDTVFLQVNDYPEVELGKDTVIRYNTSIELDAGYYNENFIWQDGSDAYYHLADSPGTYWVEVSDNIGCKTTDTIIIEPVVFNLSVPSAFSPNGDSYNKEFKVFSNYDAIYRYRMTIFNRYGELVFESNSFTDNWDGSCKHVDCPTEAYTWIIQAETFDENIFFPGKTFKTGTVTLLR